MSRLDETGLLALLHDGQNQQPRWSGFLRELQRRLRADVASLLFCHGDPEVARAVLWRAADYAPPPSAHPSAVLNALRPDRVYGFDELMPETPPASDAPRFGRIVRVGDASVWSAWLIIARHQSDFSAADGVLLSALAPHLAIAMRLFAAMERQRLHADAADDLLARLGVTWGFTDDHGQLLPFERAPPLNKTTERALLKAAATNTAMVANTAREDGAPTLLAIDAPNASLTAPTMAHRAVILRAPVTLQAHQATCFEQLWSLSPSEARLTAAIANGQSLAEAAESAGLTIETARNYSKRIYAKSGARGLADLVRLALNSVAALA